MNNYLTENINTCQRNEHLNTFRSTIEQCKQEITTVKIAEEASFEYAILRVLCRIIVSSCEINTLLNNGFPEGALALARQLYEGWVIVRVLLNAKTQNDTALLSRFFDAIEISDLNNSLCIIQWVCSETRCINETITEREMLKQQEKAWLKKYKKKKLDEFKDYWWAECAHFEDLVKKANLNKDYMYCITSSRVHLNVQSIFHPLDHSESGILIGDTHNGWYLPLSYSVLCLRSIVGDIRTVMPLLLTSQLFEKLDDLSMQLKSFNP